MAELCPNDIITLIDVISLALTISCCIRRLNQESVQWLRAWGGIACFPFFLHFLLSCLAPSSRHLDLMNGLYRGSFSTADLFCCPVELVLTASCKNSISGPSSSMGIQSTLPGVPVVVAATLLLVSVSCIRTSW
jgi:hypothetical protein